MNTFGSSSHPAAIATSSSDILDISPLGLYSPQKHQSLSRQSTPLCPILRRSLIVLGWFGNVIAILMSFVTAPPQSLLL